MQKKLHALMLLYSFHLVAQDPTGILKTNEAQVQAPQPQIPQQAPPSTVASDLSASAPAQPSSVILPATVPAQNQPSAAPAPLQEAPAAQTMQVEQAPSVPEQPAQEAPAPIVPAPQPAPVVEEAPEMSDFDNVNLAEPKGNWLYKRIWWEKAERLYEKIKELADKILEFRMIYFAKRHELEHSILDPFYGTLGVTDQELDQAISYFLQKAGQEKTTPDESDNDQEQAEQEKEREFLATIIQEKKTLEQMKEDLQAIGKINHAIDDALIKLIEQLNNAHYYEQQAWTNFKAINRELSDKRARELYYSMDTYWKNLNNINAYLSDAFAHYFDQLTAKVTTLVDDMKTNLAALKEKKVDIQLQAQTIKRRAAGDIIEREQEEPDQEQSTGFMSRVWGWIKAPFVFVTDALGGGLDWIFGLFGKGSAQAAQEESSSASVDESIDVQE